ncbi:alpha/beta fold hydrolase [Nonomuraea sp. M3C6]|uniref:Alpha/beta fold hydrolase n=1 Tax=Nonomuraea marmarensis TaxID=3351344 RepID=A0ABW7AN27_9ACTN
MLVLAMSAVAPPAASTAIPPLTLLPCGNAAECASIPVPLDWAHPDGPHITLAFALHRASTPARRIGTLVFLNGTGVSSEQFVADRIGQGKFPAELINRFDIVGVDPRGGGTHPNNTPIALPTRSTPLRCDLPPHAPGSSYFPTTDDGYQALIAHNRAFAHNCSTRTGGLVEHMDSASQARDLEAVRRALGEPSISLYAWTSGNQVALAYLSRYPQHVRAIALDQPADPDRSTWAYLASDAAAVQDEFDRFVRWCDKTASCVLHGTDIPAAYDQLVAYADRHPIPTSLGFAMTGDEIQMVTDEILQLGDLVLQGSGPEALTGFGALAAAIEQARQAPKTGGGLPYFEIEWVNSIGWTGSAEPYRITSCDDLPARPVSLGQFQAWSRSLTRTAPDTHGASPAWEALSGCAGWPLPTAARQHPLPFGPRTPPALIISSLHSAFAAPQQQKWLHQRLPGSRLLTYAGDTHVNYLSSTCIRDRLQDYLITGILPPEETTCPQEGPLAGHI